MYVYIYIYFNFYDNVYLGTCIEKVDSGVIQQYSL